MKNFKLLTLIACLTTTISSASAMNPATPTPPQNPSAETKSATAQATISISGGDTIPTVVKLTKPTQPPQNPSAETKSATAQSTISISGGDTTPTALKPTIPPKPSIPIPENIHGLNNISASCYLNSLVQIMYHTKAIHKHITSSTFTSTETQNLKLLFEDMDKAAKSAVVNPQVRYAGMKFHRGSDDPQYVFLVHFAKDLEEIIDLDSEMDNPVLLDGTPLVDKTKEKNKPDPTESTPAPVATTSSDDKKDSKPATPENTTNTSKPGSTTLDSLLTIPPEKTPKGKSAVGFSIATCRSGGHYYAIVKEDGKWFKINDSGVSYVGDTYESAVSCVKKAGHLFRFVSYE